MTVKTLWFLLFLVALPMNDARRMADTVESDDDLDVDEADGIMKEAEASKKSRRSNNANQEHASANQTRRHKIVDEEDSSDEQFDWHMLSKEELKIIQAYREAKGARTRSSFVEEGSFVEEEEGSFVEEEYVQQGRHMLSDSSSDKIMLWEKVDEYQEVTYFSDSEAQGSLGMSNQGFEKLPNMKWEEIETPVETDTGSSSDQDVILTMQHSAMHTTSYAHLPQMYMKDGGSLLLFQSPKWNGAMKIKKADRLQEFFKGVKGRDVTYEVRMTSGCRGRWYGRLDKEPEGLQWYKACPKFGYQKSGPWLGFGNEVRKMVIPLVFDEDFAREEVNSYGGSLSWAIEAWRMKQYKKGLLYIKYRCDWNEDSRDNEISILREVLYLKHEKQNLDPEDTLPEVCRSTDHGMRRHGDDAYKQFVS